jgi:hypothetical protein
MEYGNTETTSRQTNHASIADLDGAGELVRQRLDWLIQENAENALKKTLFHSAGEELDAALLKKPLSVEKTFAYFGLLLGTFPPAAIFTRFLIDNGIFRGEDYWILGVVAIVNLISALTGYLSGRLIGKIVLQFENQSWSKMLLALPFVGMFWGIIAGGAAGIIILGVGAFFGAILGGLVGGAALPVFSIFHRLLKRGDKIESKHFLPLAFGIAFIISAFFLGL